MEFFKKNLTKSLNVYAFPISDNKTKKVTEFYKTSPFPNYKLNDNKSTLLEKTKL